jgi:hypothetical protein
MSGRFLDYDEVEELLIRKKRKSRREKNKYKGRGKEVPSWGR